MNGIDGYSSLDLFHDPLDLRFVKFVRDNYFFEVNRRYLES